MKNLSAPGGLLNPLSFHLFNLTSDLCNLISAVSDCRTIKTPSMPKKNDLHRQVSEAILACQDKKAEQVTILELEKESGAFTDYFVVCSGTNPRQIQTIADAVDERLEALGLRPAHSEGYKQAEWVLLDYVDFVVHIFSEKARQYYDLERLWKSAKRLSPEEIMRAPKTRRATRPTAPRARKKRA